MLWSVKWFTYIYQESIVGKWLFEPNEEPEVRNQEVTFYEEWVQKLISRYAGSLDLRGQLVKYSRSFWQVLQISQVFK